MTNPRLTIKDNAKPRKLHRMTTVPERELGKVDFGVRKREFTLQRFNLTTGMNKNKFGRKRLSARAQTINMSDLKP